ncbi:extracellular solute-binding protein [Streptomyces sp. 6N223]|uniref:extracellular solute-binding protein n=1 Tax=Streptomyces sp. 6N223 TaxID=3457412 RepID=UPI003FD20444
MAGRNDHERGWATGLEQVVEVWNESHPAIQVTFKEQAGGDEPVTRTINAAQAGEAPDLMQAEYQALPTLVSNEVLADISEYAGDIEGEFTPASGSRSPAVLEP